MSTPVRLVLPAQIHAEMVQHAQSELPNECCGMLAGRLCVESGLCRVEQRYPLVNELASPRAYRSDPRSMFDAEKARRLAGLEFVATYHSHPTSAAIPSATDLAQNYSPDVACFILGMLDEPPTLRGWWLTESDYREAEWEVV